MIYFIIVFVLSVSRAVAWGPVSPALGETSCWRRKQKEFSKQRHQGSEIGILTISKIAWQRGIIRRRYHFYDRRERKLSNERAPLKKMTGKIYNQMGKWHSEIAFRIRWFDLILFNRFNVKTRQNSDITFIKQPV